jgi:hypothetical protein
MRKGAGGAAEPFGRKMISELVGLLMAGRELHLNFPDGTEQPWQGSLAGSTKILTEMMNCKDRLATAAKPTQPYGAGRPPGRRSGPHARSHSASSRGPCHKGSFKQVGPLAVLRHPDRGGLLHLVSAGPFRRPARVCCRAWRPARGGRPAPPQGILV